MTFMVRQWIPFDDAPWSPDQRRSFDFIQAWVDALKAGDYAGKSREALKDLFEEDAARIEAERASQIIPRRLLDAVRADADGEPLRLEWLTKLVRSAHFYHGPLQFASSIELKQFLEAAVVPRGYLVASLADVAHRWQLPQVYDLAVAFFLVTRLVTLPEDLARDRLFIPLADLDQAGVTIAALKAGQNDAGVQKLLWKQVVRVRDAFAQGQPLLKEVPRKFRRSFKRNWLTGLELINEIERKKYDVWSRDIQLTAVQQFQVSVLSLIGRGASQARGR